MRQRSPFAYVDQPPFDAALVVNLEHGLTWLAVAVVVVALLWIGSRLRR